MQIDDQMTVRAREQMQIRRWQASWPPEMPRSVEAGSAKGEILRYAREHNIDLIVLAAVSAMACRYCSTVPRIGTALARPATCWRCACADMRQAGRR